MDVLADLSSIFYYKNESILKFTIMLRLRETITELSTPGHHHNRQHIQMGFANIQAAPGVGNAGYNLFGEAEHHGRGTSTGNGLPMLSAAGSEPHGPGAAA